MVLGFLTKRQIEQSYLNFHCIHCQSAIAFSCILKRKNNLKCFPHRSKGRKSSVSNHATLFVRPPAHTVSDTKPCRMGHVYLRLTAHFLAFKGFRDHFQDQPIGRGSTIGNAVPGAIG